MNHPLSLRRGQTARGALALLSVLVLLSNSVPAGAGVAQTASVARAAGRMSEEQRIVHVLNRLGFGARPGDVERVRAMGLDAYIERQLNPEKIDDRAVEAKLDNLPTLRMTTGELLAKYPAPGRLIRELQRRGELPADLDALREMREGRAPRAAGDGPPTGGRQMMNEGDDAMSAPGAAAPKKGDEGAAMRGDEEDARRQYRRAAMRYMAENGLQPPQRVTQELNASRILRAVYSERQLQEVMVDFWSNHFNVFAGKGADRWFLTSYDRDVIRPHALGNFRDLLEATAKSPAMLFYLDNFQSVSPNARRPTPEQEQRFLQQLPPDVREQLEQQGYGVGGGRNPGRNPGRLMRRQGRGGLTGGARPGGQQAPQGGQQNPQQQRQRPRRGINENYARELMELHTLGVEGGYTQKDVQEVARAFTGWTIINPRGYVQGMEAMAGRFVFLPRTHDDGEKTVLGHKIPAGGGMKDGQLVLDILARHPSTARFIATKLSRRFVSDNPDRALVERVAAAYLKSDGDIRETLRALFASPEFNAAEARRAKIKTPFELAVSAVRALGAETNAGPALHQWVARMGEPLYGYQAPTGYPDTAEYWVNTGALLERLNFALALAGNRIPGTRVDLARFVGDEADSSRAVNQERVVDQFLKLILAGDISPNSRAVLMKQLGDQATAPVTSAPADETATGSNVRAARRERREEGATVGNPEVTRIAALVIGSPEFQRQ